MFNLPLNYVGGSIKNILPIVKEKMKKILQKTKKKQTQGERLKLLREFKKLSQKKFGELLDKEGYQIRDIEIGKVELSSSFAKLIHYVFGANLSWLLDGESEMYLEEKPSSPARESDTLRNLENRMTIIEELLSQQVSEKRRRWYESARGKK